MNWKEMAGRNGLVPMRVVRAFAPYMAGSVAGFSPKMAAMLYDRGDAIPVGQDLPVKGKRPGPAAKVTAPITTVENVVEIPVDILKKHHLQRLKVARELLGDAYPLQQQNSGMTPTEFADKVINEELARRASGTVKDLDEDY